MKKIWILICILYVLHLCSLPVCAQQISKEVAKEKALAFLSKSAKTRKASPELVLANDQNEFYIFNNESNGGYIIVSGDERTPDVLGYSDNGHYDSKHVPCNMQAVLDGYAKQIAYLRAHPDFRMSVPSKTRNEVVEPLLGETAWDQDWPYNNMCPMIVDGEHCLTGCVATATAQVMYYHKWPERGQGEKSYEWKGQTLSADFSQSVYRWDLMVPTYNAGSSQESCDAVALLMRDIGYACEMYYGRGGSSPHISNEDALINYFDYDESLAIMSRDECDADSWNGFIIDDLLNGQPVLYEGFSQDEESGHALVIDGYDGNGYYHFNFGWGGGSNGNYTMLSISYNTDQSISFGIHKNEGGEKRVFFTAKNDFVYVPENDLLECKTLRCTVGCRGSRRQTALAVENTTTHEIIYVDITPDSGLEHVEFHLYETLPDGDYILYPVARLSDEQTWQKHLFFDQCQTFVDLNVTNGIKTYANNHIPDYIQDGVVDIDGIFYILNSNHEATVTSKNNHYNSYSGDVDIPAMVNYQNEEYLVRTIGKDAFASSKGLTSVIIPNNVITISDHAFQDCTNLTSIIISKSINSIGWGSFYRCLRLSDIYLYRTDPWAYGCSEGAFAFEFPISTCTLHVPTGCKEKYVSTSPWSAFKNIIEDEALGMTPINLGIVTKENYYSIDGKHIKGKPMKKGVFIKNRQKIVVK